MVNEPIDEKQPKAPHLPAYDGRGWTLFFPEPPDDLDMANFQRSLSPQVQLFWDTATPALLARFASIKRRRRGVYEGVRIILRIMPKDLDRPRHVLRAQFEQKQHWAGGQIIAVLCGNEPDPQCLRWHMPNGQPCAWSNEPDQPDGSSPWSREMALVLQCATNLDGYGIHLVSPAYQMHGLSPDDPADPGLFSLRELAQPVYYGYDSPITANGVHYYDHGWWERDPPPPPEGATRERWIAWAITTAGAKIATHHNTSNFKQAVRFWSGYHHHIIFWDESNTFRTAYSEAQHMEACIGKSKILIHDRSAEGYRVGERVAMFSPFSSNGLANHYPAQYVMRDPGSYEMVRRHLIEDGGYGE